LNSPCGDVLRFEICEHSVEVVGGRGNTPFSVCVRLRRHSVLVSVAERTSKRTRKSRAVLRRGRVPVAE
jgi:hypothetical protein